MSDAAAGICLLKCFCLCFCCTFSAKPDPRIPCSHDNHQGNHNHHNNHTGQVRQVRHRGRSENTDRKDPAGVRCVYRGQGEEGDGEDAETRGDGLPDPRLGHLVPVPDGGDGHLEGQQRHAPGSHSTTNTYTPKPHPGLNFSPQDAVRQALGGSEERRGEKERKEERRGEK